MLQTIDEVRLASTKFRENNLAKHRAPAFVAGVLNSSLDQSLPGSEERLR